MNWVDWVAGASAVFLLIYLVIVLIRAEWCT